MLKAVGLIALLLGTLGEWNNFLVKQHESAWESPFLCSHAFLSANKKVSKHIMTLCCSGLWVGKSIFFPWICLRVTTCRSQAHSGGSHFTRRRWIRNCGLCEVFWKPLNWNHISIFAVLFCTLNSKFSWSEHFSLGFVWLKTHKVLFQDSCPLRVAVTGIEVDWLSQNMGHLRTERCCLRRKTTCAPRVLMPWRLPQICGCCGICVLQAGFVHNA